MNKQTVLAIVLLVGLAGCGSTKYSCLLEPGSSCRSMSAVWENQTKPASATSPLGSNTAIESRANPKTVSLRAEQLGFQGEQQGDPGGTPIYITGKPYMVWVPGSKDAEGRVQSGRYIYFATPADWAMGSITEARSGGDILGPKKPEGFVGATPVGAKPNQAATSMTKPMADPQVQQSKGSEVFPIVRAPEPKKN